ncbi:U2 small nuclear ribonucleoprotein A'-like [Lineus longissimus]|uniref:U2 small nuclear ribonucleoprotein A'-like n=1 Tax=Lineus longissimus TaxID=88925 RepID=UPI002B4F3FE2
MVKLTPELIEQSAQFTNPVRDRELDLRGYKIPVIENLGATLDQFDTIDFTDNDIRKLDGFPLLKRLKSLLLSNNRIVRIAEGLDECIPNLEEVVLTNNNLQELGDLDNLTPLKNLKSLSLLRNPVTMKKHYRLYVVHKLPQVRLLDFRKVRLREREAAAQMFKGKRGQQLAREIGKRAKTFVPGAGIPEKKQQPTGPTKEEVDAIKAAIANASTLEEVEKLNMMLRSGQIPGQFKKGVVNDAEEVEEVEEMEAEMSNGAYH